MKSVSTFWSGNSLSNQEKACLASFVGTGHEVSIYSFDNIDDLPDGVIFRNANEIDDGRLIDQFFYNGKPNLQLYSDYFRLKMMSMVDTYWVDSDVVSLKNEELPDGLIVGLEDKSVICNAILRIPSNQPGLHNLIESVERLEGKNLPWGETGHVLLQNFLVERSELSSARPAEIFYPIHWSEFWKPLLPGFHDECEYLCSSGRTLHLWNNLISQMGFWKKIGPPKGSFLYRSYERSNALYPFDEFYPGDLMYRLVENWVARDGGHLGLKRVARILGSSFRNTANKTLKRNNVPLLDSVKSRSPLANRS